ncbi:hypothetical protein [Kitasatospora sp. McL0602]|uniref:hypothetical protein n=1 Tax=Kitasatospora sp. McL0602 TaxID=3439530 RepID=UPI003F8B5D5D
MVPVVGSLDIAPAEIRGSLAAELRRLPASVDRRTPAEQVVAVEAALSLGMVECRARWNHGGWRDVPFTLGRLPSLSGRARRAAPGFAVPLAELCGMAVRSWWPGLTLTLLGAALQLQPELAVLIAVCVLTLAGSVILHEWGHLAAYRLAAARDAPVVVSVRPGRCAVVHEATGDRWKEVAVTVAGPAFPATCGVLFAATSLLPGLARVVVAGVGLAHLLGLLAPVGDGASLRAALREGHAS